MRGVATIFVLLLCLVTSGCSSYGSEYDAVAYYLRGGSAAQGSVMERCIERRISEKSRKIAAAELNIPESRVGAVICSRVVKGISSGRITREDYIALYGEEKVTPNMQKVLLGR